MSKKFLALVGSPRVDSTSGHFANYLVKGFAAKGWEVRTLTAAAAIRHPELWPELEKAFHEADVVGLLTPLYVDSLPAELTAALERLASSSRPSARDTPRKLFAVLNYGRALCVAPAKCRAQVSGCAGVALSIRRHPACSLPNAIGNTPREEQWLGAGNRWHRSTQWSAFVRRR